MLKPYNFLILCFCFFSCDKTEVKPEEPEKPVSQYQAENTWIYKEMVKNYLWSKEMPREDSTDKFLEPIDYYYSLLSKENDKFSYIKPSYQEVADYWNGTIESFGFRYTKILDSASTFNMAVSLVIKGSTAEQAGLKRGDLITAVNGTPVTQANITDLLANTSAVFSVKRDSSQTQVNLSKHRFQINPIQDYRIIEVGGKKIGYLLFIQFLFGFEDELRGICKYFNDNNIDDMVVDLRFNPGGVTPIAEIVSTLLAPNVGPNTVLFKGHTNGYQARTKDDGARYFTSETQNLAGINRLFVLTSRSSSSSSELVINCIRPYRPVYTVGSNTYGKNVISTIIRDETDKFSYTLMPAWGTIENARGESTYGKGVGISADFPVQDNLLPYYPLGSPSETLLKRALESIVTLPTDSLARKPVTLLDNFHHFDTGTGFLGNTRYNP